MSHEGNTQLLESYRETFEESVMTENWDLARALIGDMRDAGFGEQATVLERELVAKQNAV